MADFSHLTEDGTATMVSTRGKAPTERRAETRGQVSISQACRDQLDDPAVEEIVRAARIAGIQGAKLTSQLIPFCHQVALSRVDVSIDFNRENSCFVVTSTTEASDVTGVEMEALTATSVASLTIYDMIKAVDVSATLGPIQVTKKSGGKADYDLLR